MWLGNTSQMLCFAYGFNCCVPLGPLAVSLPANDAWIDVTRKGRDAYLKLTCRGAKADTHVVTNACLYMVACAGVEV